MKLISAIVNPSRLDAIRVILAEIGIHGMTVTEVKGYGPQRRRNDLYRGDEYGVSFVPKLKIEVAVSADLVERINEAIITVARTGRSGDGKIFNSDLRQLVRLRTGEAGPLAI